MRNFFAVLLALFGLCGFADAQQNFMSYYILQRELEILTVAKIPISYQEVPRKVRIITREEIERIGAQNLFDLLRYLPEFYVWRGHFYLKAVGTTGVRESYFSEKIQVLIDGVPITDPSTGSSFSTDDNIPLSGIERVEVVYGPLTSLYGFNASLVIINLITEKKANKVGVSLSTSGAKNFYALQSFNEKGFKGNVWVSYMDENVPHDTTKYRDLQGRLHYGDAETFNKHFNYFIRVSHDSGFYFTLMGVNRDSVFPVSVTYFPTNGDNSYTDRTAYINRFGVKKRFGNFDVDTYGFFNWFYLKRGYNVFPELGLKAVEERYVRNFGGGISASFPVFEGYSTFGIETQKVDMYKVPLYANFENPQALYNLLAVVTSGSGNYSSVLALMKPSMEEVPESKRLFVSPVKRIVLSPYLQFFKEFEKTSFLISARVNKTTDVGSQVGWSAGISRILNPKVKLKLTAGKSVRIPSFEELHVRNNIIYRGNENLTYEKVYSVLPSVEYSSDSVDIGITLYYNFIKNLIYRRPSQNPRYKYEWSNANHPIIIKGLILNAKKKFENFEVFGGIGRKFKVQGSEDVEYFWYPRWKGVVGVTLFSGNKSLTIWGHGISRVNKDVSGYFVGNVSLNWNTELGRIFAKVENIFDKKIYYRANPEVVEEGRTLWVGLEYSF